MLNVCKLFFQVVCYKIITTCCKECEETIATAFKFNLDGEINTNCEVVSGTERDMSFEPDSRRLPSSTSEDDISDSWPRETDNSGVCDGEKINCREDCESIVNVAILIEDNSANKEPDTLEFELKCSPHVFDICEVVSICKNILLAAGLDVPLLRVFINNRFETEFRKRKLCDVLEERNTLQVVFRNYIGLRGGMNNVRNNRRRRRHGLATSYDPPDDIYTLKNVSIDIKKIPCRWRPGISVHDYNDRLSAKGASKVQRWYYKITGRTPPTARSRMDIPTNPKAKTYSGCETFKEMSDSLERYYSDQNGKQSMLSGGENELILKEYEKYENWNQLRKKHIDEKRNATRGLSTHKSNSDDDMDDESDSDNEMDEQEGDIPHENDNFDNEPLDDDVEEDPGIPDEGEVPFIRRTDLTDEGMRNLIDDLAQDDERDAMEDSEEKFLSTNPYLTRLMVLLMYLFFIQRHRVPKQIDRSGQFHLFEVHHETMISMMVFYRNLTFWKYSTMLKRLREFMNLLEKNNIQKFSEDYRHYVTSKCRTIFSRRHDKEIDRIAKALTFSQWKFIMSRMRRSSLPEMCLLALCKSGVFHGQRVSLKELLEEEVKFWILHLQGDDRTPFPFDGVPFLLRMEIVFSVWKGRIEDEKHIVKIFFDCPHEQLMIKEMIDYAMELEILKVKNWEEILDLPNGRIPSTGNAKGNFFHMLAKSKSYNWWNNYLKNLFKGMGISTYSFRRRACLTWGALFIYLANGYVDYPLLQGLVKRLGWSVSAEEWEVYLEWIFSRLLTKNLRLALFHRRTFDQNVTLIKRQILLWDKDWKKPSITVKEEGRKEAIFFNGISFGQNTHKCYLLEYIQLKETDRLKEFYEKSPLNFLRNQHELLKGVKTSRSASSVKEKAHIYFSDNHWEDLKNDESWKEFLEQQDDRINKDIASKKGWRQNESRKAKRVKFSNKTTDGNKTAMSPRTRLRKPL